MFYELFLEYSHFPGWYFYNSLLRVSGRLQKKPFFFFFFLWKFWETLKKIRNILNQPSSTYYKELTISAKWHFFRGTVCIKKQTNNNPWFIETNVCCQWVVSLLQNITVTVIAEVRLCRVKQECWRWLVKSFLCSVICSWLADSWGDPQLSAQSPAFSFLSDWGDSPLKPIATD